jgi:hypothetical protein
MSDDDLLLASAYLDGDVSDDERARVEADPTLLAEVQRLREVRSLLGDLAPSSIARREEHLATALAAWDRLPDTERTGAIRDATPAALRRGADAAAVAAAASVTAPVSLADRRRSKVNRRVLAVAAAVVVVLGGGLVVRNIDMGGGDDDLATFDAVGGAPDTAASDAAAGAPSAEPQVAQLEAAEGEGDGADERSASTLLDTGANDPAPPGERVLDRLETPDDLAQFASLAVGAPTSPDVPAATSAPAGDQDQAAILAAELPRCLGVDFVVGPALYQGREVIVGVDEGLSLALAYRADCREVARAPLP